MSEEFIFTTGLGLLAAAGLYSWQKMSDRKELVRGRHYEVYLEMQVAISGLANSVLTGGGQDEAFSAYFMAKMKFAVVGSDEAMKYLAVFDSLITGPTNVDSSEIDGALVQLMRQLRKENLGKTSVSNSDLLSVTPFGKSSSGRAKK